MYLAVAIVGNGSVLLDATKGLLLYMAGTFLTRRFYCLYMQKSCKLATLDDFSWWNERKYVILSRKYYKVVTNSTKRMGFVTRISQSCDIIEVYDR